MEEEIYEPNWEDCEYCEVVYFESDTGYREVDCGFVKEYWKNCKNVNTSCVGGEFASGCPLAFKYTIEE